MQCFPFHSSVSILSPGTGSGVGGRQAFILMSAGKPCILPSQQHLMDRHAARKFSWQGAIDFLPVRLVPMVMSGPSPATLWQQRVAEGPEVWGGESGHPPRSPPPPPSNKCPEPCDPVLHFPHQPWSRFLSFRYLGVTEREACWCQQGSGRRGGSDATNMSSGTHPVLVHQPARCQQPPAT